MANVLRSRDAVRGYIEQICFKTGPPSLVGVELEWLLIDPRRPHEPVPIPRVRDALAAAPPFPGGSTVTFEPGGQVELSSPPAGLSPCWRALRADVNHLTRILTDAGLCALSTGVDPYRTPRRQVTQPRYDAMEVYFDRRGPHGRLMMCSTAAIQINLDAGRDAAEVTRHWRLLNTIGPVMVAAFANSPVLAGRTTGWKSARQAIWHRLDPARTHPPAGSDPAAAWTAYALDAPVMLLRADGGRWTSDPGVTFATWVGGGRPDRDAPTDDDLRYHLTTLFPPVRPRGWFEVRYIDTLPPDLWAVPLAVLTALGRIPWAREIAQDAAAPVAGAWDDAARHGLARAALARAAQRCFEIALAALPDVHADPELIALVEWYTNHYISRCRCPADDVLDASPTCQPAPVSV